MDTERLLKLLKENKVAFLVIGASAFPVYGYARATLDINLFVKCDLENIRKTIKALEECVKKIFELNPESSHSERFLGIIQYKWGNAQRVLKHMKQALAIDLNDPEALLFLIVAYNNAGKTFAAKNSSISSWKESDMNVRILKSEELIRNLSV